MVADPGTADRTLFFSGENVTFIFGLVGLDSPSRSPSSSASVRGWCLTRGDGFISASPDRVSDAVWDTTQRSVWDRLVEVDSWRVIEQIPVDQMFRFAIRISESCAIFPQRASCSMSLFTDNFPCLLVTCLC